MKPERGKHKSKTMNMSIFDQTPDTPSNCCFGTYSHETVSSMNHEDMRIQPQPIWSSWHRGGQLLNDDEIMSLSSPSSLMNKEDEREKKEIDTLLAQAMNKLTFEEREKIQDTIHGVEGIVEEDVTCIDNALDDLNGHLLSIKRGSIYEIAESMDPSYVGARAFRLMFLRANEYDGKASAEQMIKFFDLKHRLFGIDKLVKDIKIQDLDDDDIACLKDGWAQLAGRDKSGRQIHIRFGGLLEATENLQSAIRALYFVTMRSLKSEETQIRGNVSVWYAIGDLASDANNKYSETFLAARALPQKKAAIHFCADDVRQFVLTNPLVKVMTTNLRVRLRLHLGSQMECQYRLSTYGILPQLLPLDGLGRLTLDRHLQWVRECMMEDKFGRSISPPEAIESTIITPSEKDVLFTGGKQNNHEGNRVFYLVVQEHSAAYDFGTAETKRHVVSFVIDEIHRIGGRFLQKTMSSNSDILWKEVSYDEARQKVMQTFRNLRRRHVHITKQNVSCTDGALIEDTPTPQDVIFGKAARRNPGSKLLHRLIKDRLEEYESLSRGVKLTLVEAVMQTIKDNGGRFLQPLPKEGKWIEVPKESVRERISKYFRNHRRASSS